MDMNQAKAEIRRLYLKKGFALSSVPPEKIEALARELIQREDEKRALLGPKP